MVATSWEIGGVFGGTQDAEFAEASQRFLRRVAAGELTLLVSTEVLRELRDAPEAVRAALDAIGEAHLQQFPVGPEVIELADAYIAAGVLPQRCWPDALHVAAATVAQADLIVSWNFKHIVNYDRISRYNAVNALNGYRQIDIRSPAEIAYGPEDEDL